MNTKLLTIAALALSLTGGAAFAQQATQEGGSEATATMNERGTPLLEGDMGMAMGGFFTDDTFTTLRTEEEMGTAYSALTPEQQTMLRDGCAAEQAQTERELPESVIQVCTMIGSM